VDANALQKPKRFFGAARSIGAGQPLHRRLIGTGARMEEVLRFKGTGNYRAYYVSPAERASPRHRHPAHVNPQGRAPHGQDDNRVYQLHGHACRGGAHPPGTVSGRRTTRSSLDDGGTGPREHER
jgi:hypothetical protein